MTARVLVTGAGGFIGRWSLAPLRAAGFEVHAVLRPGAAAPAEAGATVVHAADLLECTALDALLQSVRPTHLLHFAWVATPGVYANSEENFRWLQSGGHLLRAFHAAGGRRVVMAGSCAEYDWSRAGLCHEFDTPLADAGPTPPSAYARCKLAMQRELQRFAGTHGLSWAWGRIFLQYGPHEHPRRLVSSAITNLLRGRDAPATHGAQVRSFLHVADLGAAFAALLAGAAEGPVNIGAGEPLSIAALLAQIEGQIGGPGRVRLGALPAPPGEPAVLIPDLRRLGGEVGWAPRYALADGLAGTIDWWREALGREAGRGGC